MDVWRHTLETAPHKGPCVVALGIFDGVHLGHLEILATTVAHAQQLGVPAVVVTFDPHPTVVVTPERRPRLLMTLEQRLAAFREACVDCAWVIPFSRIFSELEPEVFLASFQRVLEPVALHIGTGFCFGRDRSGTLSTLQDWSKRSGCQIHAHALKAPDGGLLSSTRVRDTLDVGEVEAAATMLGHPFVLTGIVVEGERRGRHLGFPTANLAWEQEQLPASGVYISEVASSHLDAQRLGLTNIGEKPTFEGQRLTVETHLPDFEGDLYGARMTLSFLRRLRDEQCFANLDTLCAQIRADIETGQSWWHAHR